jgi:hypothetical protein
MFEKQGHPVDSRASRQDGLECVVSEFLEGKGGGKKYG